MYKFDESLLLEQITPLSSQARVAFAAAAATRQLGNYERFSRNLNPQNELIPRKIVTQLWEDLQLIQIRRAKWQTKLDEVMDLLPEENDDWMIAHTLADDALSSLAYAIRCLLIPEPQEAVWAARRAYEAADQAAIRILGVHPGSPDTELTISMHVFVQRELSRQQNDLSLLRREDIKAVHNIALTSDLLNDSEFFI